jgi:hypothetical protein
VDNARGAVIAGELALSPVDCEAGYLDSMASKGFSVVLAVDIEASRATADTCPSPKFRRA